MPDLSERVANLTPEQCMLIMADTEEGRKAARNFFGYSDDVGSFFQKGKFFSGCGYNGGDVESARVASALRFYGKDQVGDYLNRELHGMLRLHDQDVCVGDRNAGMYIEYQGRQVRTLADLADAFENGRPVKISISVDDILIIACQ